jgi:hypothetical protein
MHSPSQSGEHLDIDRLAAPEIRRVIEAIGVPW